MNKVNYVMDNITPRQLREILITGQVTIHSSQFA